MIKMRLPLFISSLFLPTCERWVRYDFGEYVKFSLCLTSRSENSAKKYETLMEPWRVEEFILQQTRSCVKERIRLSRRKVSKCLKTVGRVPSKIIHRADSHHPPIPRSVDDISAGQRAKTVKTATVKTRRKGCRCCDSRC